MEDRSRTGLHDFTRASRKAEESGSWVLIFQVIFAFGFRVLCGFGNVIEKKQWALIELTN